MMNKYRNDFKILGQGLVYLDSAASSLKPSYVLDKIQDLSSNYISTLSKGGGQTAQNSEKLVSITREKLTSFIGSPTGSSSIVFTPNATSAINLVAYGYIDRVLGSDGSILITNEEHHSDVLPWMKIVSKSSGRSLKIADITKGSYLESVLSLIDDRVKLISLSLVGNVYGRINLEDIKIIIKEAHKRNILVFIDAAQAPLTIKIDIKDLDPDFLVISSHKMFAIGNTGVLYVRDRIINDMVPTIIGGGTVSDLKIDVTSLEDSTLKVDTKALDKIVTCFDSYHRFEIGTQPVLDIISIGYALDYIESIGVDRFHAINQENLAYLRQKLRQLDFVDLIEYPGIDIDKELSSIISFNLRGIHCHDVGFLLGEKNICLRSGMQCASLLFNTLKIPGCLRASLGIYNTQDDIDRLVDELTNIYSLFSKKSR